MITRFLRTSAARVLLNQCTRTCVPRFKFSTQPPKDNKGSANDQDKKTKPQVDPISYYKKKFQELERQFQTKSPSVSAKVQNFHSKLDKLGELPEYSYDEQKFSREVQAAASKYEQDLRKIEAQRSSLKQKQAYSEQNEKAFAQRELALQEKATKLFKQRLNPLKVLNLHIEFLGEARKQLDYFIKQGSFSETEKKQLIKIRLDLGEQIKTAKQLRQTYYDQPAINLLKDKRFEVFTDASIQQMQAILSSFRASFVLKKQSKSTEDKQQSEKSKDDPNKLTLKKILEWYREIQKQAEKANKDGMKLEEMWETVKDKFEYFKKTKYYEPWYLIGALVLWWYYKQTVESSTLTQKEFYESLETGIVNQIFLVRNSDKTKNEAKVKQWLECSHGGRRKAVNINGVDNTLVQELKAKHPALKVETQLRPGWRQVKRFFDSIISVGFAVFAVSMVSLIRKQGNIMKGGFMKKKFEMVKNVGVRFKDVAGLEQSKLEIEQFVDFLKNPQRYRELGAKIPKGALLSGPPGTGKTMLAKACAGEAGVPFFFVSGSEFVEMYVGVGSMRVRQLFQQAKKNSPSIIFIDELDAIGKKRENRLGSNDEKENTLNQLLVEMDGFSSNTDVIVLAATNRKQMLDPALIRPGRFDRSIEVTLPDLQGRAEIFKVHLTPLKLDVVATPFQQLARRLATLTPGFSGAEIANLCNQAAILAARKQRQHVLIQDFEMASERVLAGIEKKSMLSEVQKRTVAVHESGHAVVAWFLKGAFPLLKVTIIPRSKGSLGFAQYLPSQNKLDTREQLVDRLCSILGGRCAEQHFFKKITTGAADDLNKAYQLAHALVTKYGMSEKVGYIGYREDSYVKEYSSETAQLIDSEIRKIIDTCQSLTMDLVQKHEDLIKKMSDALIERETLDGKAINQILGTRPFEPHESYRAFLEVQKQLQREKQTKQAPVAQTKA